MHIAFLDQFSFIENIANVACDDGLVTLEQLRHLALREPHSFVFEPHFEADGLVRLIYDNFVLVFWHDGSAWVIDDGEIYHTLHRQATVRQEISESHNSHSIA